MNCRILGSRKTLAFVVAAVVTLAAPALMDAQAARGAQLPATPPAPKVAAPIDLTGYWVSIVTEDWRFRMITPDKGDFSSVPLNPEGRRVANTWDPGKGRGGRQSMQILWRSQQSCASLDACISSGKR